MLSNVKNSVTMTTLLLQSPALLPKSLVCPKQNDRPLPDPQLWHFSDFQNQSALDYILSLHLEVKVLKFLDYQLPLFFPFSYASQFLYSTQIIRFPFHQKATNSIKSSTELKVHNILHNSHYQFSTTAQCHLLFQRW